MDKKEIIIGTKEELIEHFAPFISETFIKNFNKFAEENSGKKGVNLFDGKSGIELQLKDIEKEFKHSIGMIFYMTEHPYKNDKGEDDINIRLNSAYIRIIEKKPEVNLC